MPLSPLKRVFGMFDQGAEVQLNINLVADVSRRLKEHFERFDDMRSLVETGVPSILFEGSTSAFPHITHAALQGDYGQPPSPSKLSLIFLRFVARETAKFLLIKALALVWRLHHQRQANRNFACASVVLAGFHAEKDGALHPKDFAGFLETKLRQHRVVSLALRLPKQSLPRFFRLCDDHVVPVAAFFRWRDFVSGLRRARSLLRHYEKRRAALGLIHPLLIASVSRGHFMHSWLTAKAITVRMEKHAGAATVLCLPMERHDWEILTLYWQQARGRCVWAVQNCTFAPTDFNMYPCIEAAPSFRKAQPDRLFCISKSWAQVFKSLGFTMPIELLSQHRFSRATYPVLTDADASAVLYLGSINRTKVEFDLKALTGLKKDLNVHFRLHPSMAGKLDLGAFAEDAPLDLPYRYIFYADTSMIFQIEGDAARFIFLDHAEIPNQDPARFFLSWPGRSLVCKAGTISQRDVASLIGS